MSRAADHTLASLLRPTAAQTSYFAEALTWMQESELLEMLTLAFQMAEPAVRAELLRFAAEFTRMQPFRDGRRR
jgi:hypothetical protein